jgi:hypothetical protein
MCLIQNSKNDCALINEKSGPASADDILTWFEANLYPHREHIVFGTGCWYKNKQKKEEYRNLTIKMMQLLK